VPPLPLPSSRPGALAAALATINTYPHGGYPLIHEAIAAYAGVEPENVVLGAGADDLILLCARTFAGPGDIVAVFGDQFFTGDPQQASSLPLPNILGGTQVLVNGLPAPVYYVSAGQINFQIPSGTAIGPATVSINNSFGTSVTVQIQGEAPALFSVNSRGIAAATAVALLIPTTRQFPVPVFQCVDTPDSCQLVPIDPGLDRPVFLSFYGTGIRGRSSLDNVTVTIGAVTVKPLYAGPQPQFPGLDQVNVPLPLSLRGAGEVDVVVTVDGIASNPVKIRVI